MKAIVDSELCTGCGACEGVCSEVFQLVGDVAEVQMDPIPPDLEDSCREAMEVCPVEAITLAD